MSSSGSFLLNYDINEEEVNHRKLYVNESEIYSSIERLFSGGDYRLVITDITELSDTISTIDFEIYALSYSNYIDDVENMIKQDLDYVINSGIFYDSIKNYLNSNNLELVLSSQWHIQNIQNITQFQSSAFSLPTSIFNVQPSYFFFLGDFGKGGIEGDITSSRKLPNENNEYLLLVLFGCPICCERLLI
jgi:hypothetical protein